MLSTADLASMQATLTASLPDTAQVQRVARTSDGMGGFTESWSTVTTVACRVSPSGNTTAEQVVAERVQDRVLWTLTLPAQMDVTAADRIVVGSRTFEVVGVLAPRSYELATRVVAVEV
ncbi:MAG: head-tail adaptor protein [Chloroflexi bacterium]|nr:head-tail adaptor protein [Chloroflexota bacterium]